MLVSCAGSDPYRRPRMNMMISDTLTTATVTCMAR